MTVRNLLTVFLLFTGGFLQDRINVLVYLYKGIYRFS